MTIWTTMIIAITNFKVDNEFSYHLIILLKFI